MPKYVNQDEEPKGLSTKQIALIGVVVVVQILFIVAIFFGDDEKEEVYNYKNSYRSSSLDPAAEELIEAMIKEKENA